MLAVVFPPTLESILPMVASVAPMQAPFVLSQAGGQVQSLPGFELTEVRLPGKQMSELKRRRPPVTGATDGRPAPVFQTALSGSGAGSSASGGSGLFFFGVVGLLTLFAFGVPRLTCRLRLIRELSVPAPFVLLLDRPG